MVPGLGLHPSGSPACSTASRFKDFGFNHIPIDIARFSFIGIGLVTALYEHATIDQSHCSYLSVSHIIELERVQRTLCEHFSRVCIPNRNSHHGHQKHLP